MIISDSLGRSSSYPKRTHRHRGQTGIVLYLVVTLYEAAGASPLMGEGEKVSGTNGT